ncbi:MAG: type I 3-dehydroquinate dehydratase [Chitinispirillaceae bacterium]|nr:type I 3-dehydroquinate dehydratase [Chitinispirillaceae bacterium]
MLSLGTCTLGDQPRIVAVVDAVIPAEQLKLLASRADLLEMRIDCWKCSIETAVGYLREIRSSLSMPMIGTIRENDFTRSFRIEFFKACIPYVDGIDIELGTAISDTVTAIAQGKTVIVSEHDFSATPTIGGLSSMVERARGQGADIVKIATMANSREDVVRLLEFTRACKVPVVAFAMGPIGKVSRVIAPLFGTLFTYGYITKPVAPGQLSVEELADEIGRYFPD